METRIVGMLCPKLIYCAGGNKRLASIAIKAGYLYGARLPTDRPYFPIYFADHDWKNPDRRPYMLEIEKYRPVMATVLDLVEYGQFKEVLSWMEEVSQFCEMPVVVPKVVGSIEHIPERINGKDVVLGFSVPTGYGMTPVPEGEFRKRKVHLLGGSPHRQIEYWKRMKEHCDIISLDGNYTQRIAVRHNRFWTNGDALYSRNRWFPRLDETDGTRWDGDAPYEAFRRSCQNVMRAWENLCLCRRYVSEQ